jgi:hypothetical protein
MRLGRKIDGTDRNWKRGEEDDERARFGGELRYVNSNLIVEGAIGQQPKVAERPVTAGPSAEMQREARDWLRRCVI